ncbi:sporulation protein YpjB [Bacillus aquiflavi]|uniref:sporulation protein YpjB n=1 Tax=Bacillus aquiflavi TaxID=2672567 RepID=UPI001CA7C077|nr:sporulation protein YpjB [Bacillus aquiflavi]UAC47061.1 sporulation protein YpjB [Bacillus aquiflavi]
MRIKSNIILILIFLLITPKVNAEMTATIEKLDQISDEALQMVKLNRNDDAKRLLEYFSEQFLSTTMKERFFSMDELRIVTVSHKEALEAVTNATINHKERVNKVTKFRLAIDAITSTHQPLWTEMEGQIMTAFNDVKEAAYNGENETFHLQLNSFLMLYEMIYPSLKINIPVETIQKLDARINYIDHYRPQVLSEISSQHELEALEADLKTIFFGVTEDEADPSLWWVIISTGSIIILTLSYVGWRKNKGDKQKQTSKSKHL